MELAAHHHDGSPLQIRQIAAGQGIPDRYLEQLLATLRRSGIVRSQRGAKGGYLLSREPWEITLWDIIRCIEGLDSQTVGSTRGGSNADSLPSPENLVVQEVWKEACCAAEHVLQQYTLQDLTDKRNARQQVDLMYYI